MSLVRWDAEADSDAHELKLKRYEDDSDTSSTMSSGRSSDSEGRQQLGSTVSWVVQSSRPAYWVAQRCLILKNTLLHGQHSIG